MLFTQDARFARSPEAYPRKKLTGSDSTRIITDDSTASWVLVEMRSISRLRAAEISSFASAADSRNSCSASLPKPTSRTVKPSRAVSRSSAAEKPT